MTLDEDKDENVGSWTALQITTLCSEWAKPQTVREIARIVGKSRNACIGKAHRLQLTPKKASPSTVSIIPAIVPTMKKVRKKKTEKLPPRPVVEGEPINHKRPIGMMQLGTNTCRAPVGYDRKGMVTYCGSKTIFGKPFCPTHCRIFYTTRVA